LSCIREFADEEEQRKLWLDPANTNPHWSFVEYRCCYFDDLDLSHGGYAGAANEGLVTHDEVAAVANFHQMADDYDSPTDMYDHVAILADPNWAEVVNAARFAQAALLDVITDPHERRLLSKR
jgi:hypothetical protein